ncbi:spermatogenesis-associated protein 24-like [Tubulanus polymorphus]|uniref:spermatogenesis-associated protein 24-like n=1 Tax=Tubulanus polymorphus TaxID=672921 RepID=UPI003DA2B50A
MSIDTSTELSPHKIVQEQLKDVILLQMNHNDRLNDMVSFQANSSICKEEYDRLLKQLEQERYEHAKTRTILIEVEDKLAFAQGEIEILKKQIEREKQQYDQAFGELKNQALKESSKKVALQLKVSEIEKKVEKKEDALNSRQNQIKELNSKLARQRQEYDKKISDITVTKQQDLYIAKMLEKDGQKKKKRKHNAKSEN